MRLLVLSLLLALAALPAQADPIVVLTAPPQISRPRSHSSGPSSSSDLGFKQGVEAL